MGFSIQPRQRVGEELRFAVIGPDGLGLPLRLLTQTEAEQLAGVLNQYVDDDTVADMLAAVASFQEDDYVMTEAEAQALGDPASVDGADIVVPTYSFSETHFIPEALVTPAYKAILFYLTGKVNNAGWKGFQRDEVLFLGASGSNRGDGYWEISFRFSASPNMTNLQVGGITIANKPGWAYVWFRYQDTSDAHQLIKRPVAAYVERVYDEGDFTQIGIGA